MRNETILYWKWDEGIMEPGVLEEKLGDILARSSFTLLYVSFHHMSRPFGDALLQAKISQCALRLANAGRRLLLDIDVRNEVDGLLAQHPEGRAKYIWFFTCPLDAFGNGSLTIQNPVRGRTGRKSLSTGPSRIAGCWALEPRGSGRYASGTLRTAHCRYEVCGGHTRYSVETDAGQAGTQAVIAAVFDAAIPDLGANSTFAYYESLFAEVALLPLGGAANDEWGYDLHIQCDEGLFYVDAFPFSDSLQLDYEQETGRSLDVDCLHFAYAEAGNEGYTYGVINVYLQLLRRQMRKGNDWFYHMTKKKWGPDAFVGVHPTLWGDPTDFVLDAPHNGLSWWETKRDCAQTDEFVLLPIRLALAHKWSRGQNPVYYNMWYSGNTQQFDTYLAETWQNARYGGRTHYLGYECPNEGGVYTLKHPGCLEAIEKMEGRIARLDAFQSSQPDCRVLIVFGVEAAGNWMLQGHGGHVVRNAGPLHEMLYFAAALFDHYLCDLVPSSEIENGSVTLGHGTVRYGSQTYDAVIWTGIENAQHGVRDALEGYAMAGGQLITVGEGRCFADGAPAGDALSSGLTNFSCHLNSTCGVMDTMDILRSWGIPPNRSEHGTVFQDGTLFFTCKGRMPCHNPMDFTEILGGHQVCFRGEDFLALRFADGQVSAHVAGAARYLAVDDVVLIHDDANEGG